MARKRLELEEIVAKLRQLDVPTAQRRAAAEAVGTIGLSEVRYTPFPERGSFVEHAGLSLAWPALSRARQV